MPKSFRTLFLIVAFSLISAFPYAATGQSSPTPTAPKTKARKKVAEAKKGPTIEERLQQVAQQLKEQQEQIQQQQSQIQQLLQTNTQLRQEVQQQGQAFQSSVQHAAEQATVVQEGVKTLNTTVADLQAETKVAANAVVENKKAVTGLENPPAIHFKGVSITPGGFLAGETVNRTRATSGDLPTAFSVIPFGGNALSKLSEFNFAARQSRLSMLVETKVGSTKINGYVEGDFLGSGTTSNNRQTNSYVFRQRQLYAMAAFANGWSITGGQQWSLATENKKGIVNRQESLPGMIDPNYVVGFTWQRAEAFRVVKTINDKAAVGFSIEGPQTTIGGRGFSTFTNTSATGVVTTAQDFWLNAPGAAGSLFNAFDATGYTPNKLPDFVAKAAFDPGFGHYEILGILSTFRNRVYPCAVVSPTGSNLSGTVILNGPAINPTGCVDASGNPLTSPSSLLAYNDSRAGGGFGISAALPLVPKKADLSLKVVAGDGIGRFGATQLQDVTARPDGTLALIRSQQALAKLELHPTAKLDLYLYVGNEYAARAAYSGYSTVKVTNTPAIPAYGTQPAYPSIATYTTSVSGVGGYGNPFANNTGCGTEGVPSGTGAPSAGGTCAGDIRNIMEGTIGFWHKIYQGPTGRLQWGLQYSYVEKFAWSGAGDLAQGTPGIAPRGVDNVFFTSFRYYLP